MLATLKTLWVKIPYQAKPGNVGWYYLECNAEWFHAVWSVHYAACNHKRLRFASKACLYWQYSGIKKHEKTIFTYLDDIVVSAENSGLKCFFPFLQCYKIKLNMGKDANRQWSAHRIEWVTHMLKGWWGGQGLGLHWGHLLNVFPLVFLKICLFTVLVK